MFLFDISLQSCTESHPLSFISDSPREDPSHWDCKGCPSRIFLFLHTSCSKTLLLSPSSVKLAGLCVSDSSYVCVSAPFSEPASCLVFRLRAGLCYCPVYEPWPAWWVDVLCCVKFIFSLWYTRYHRHSPERDDRPSVTATPRFYFRSCTCQLPILHPLTLKSSIMANVLCILWKHRCRNMSLLLYGGDDQLIWCSDLLYGCFVSCVVSTSTHLREKDSDDVN